MSDQHGLTDFQLQLANIFFGLPDSTGFLLAGGAALVAQHLTNRPTMDLDFFAGPDRGDIHGACVAFEKAVHAHGWTIVRVRDTATPCGRRVRPARR